MAQKEPEGEVTTCLKDLNSIDPSYERVRIQQLNGGFLGGSHRWVLVQDDFLQWRHESRSCLLWIKGRPGTGKTMLLHGIIDEIEQSATQPISYFFCQGSDARLNNATAVLRGLIYLLASRQPTLLSHVSNRVKRFRDYGERLHRDRNCWEIMSQTLMEMLKDPVSKGAIVVIDALDECLTDLPRLVRFIGRAYRLQNGVKFLVSSCSGQKVEDRLDQSNRAVRFFLDLERSSISETVDAYIQSNMNDLAHQQGYDEETREAIRHSLQRNAAKTFLWVALVFRLVKRMNPSDAQHMIQQAPTDIESLYAYAIRRVETLAQRDQALCRRVLSTMAVAHRPLYLDELGYLANLPSEMLGSTKAIEGILNLCHPFLVVHNDIVYISHQSAKLFLTANKFAFPHGVADVHHEISLRSLEILSATLRRDIYDLGQPGTLIEDVRTPQPDPLALIKYPAIHWADHLLNSEDSKRYQSLDEGGVVDRFLQTHYLHWLESLSLLHGLSQGVRAIQSLKALQKKRPVGPVNKLLRDASRFIMFHKRAVEIAPLQVYYSALVFSPTNCKIRTAFLDQAPKSISSGPAMEAEWALCLHYRGGCSDGIASVAFSPDGSRFASGSSWFNDIQIWSTETGACLYTMKTAFHSVGSLAFSNDAQLLLSGVRNNGVIQAWDMATGSCVRAFKGFQGAACSFVFSPDDEWFAAGLSDSTVKVWDTAAGECIQTFSGHTGAVMSVALSPDKRHLASGSSDSTIRIWDLESKACIKLLLDHPNLTSIAFKGHDGYLVSAAADRAQCTVKTWDTATGICLRTHAFQSGTAGYFAASLSRDGLLVASSWWREPERLSGTITIRNTLTGDVIRTIEAHPTGPEAIAFSEDNSLLVSGSGDNSLKIWDLGVPDSEQMETHNGHADFVLFSGDGRLVASLACCHVKVWDAETGMCLYTLEFGAHSPDAIVFLDGSQRLVTGAGDRSVKIWDASTGVCLQQFEGHKEKIYQICPMGQERLASAAYDNTIKIWDMATNACIQSFDSTMGWCQGNLAVASDSRLVAASDDHKRIKVWDATTGDCVHSFEGNSERVTAIAFSKDANQLAESSSETNIRIWDLVSGTCAQTLVNTAGTVHRMAFSEGGLNLASSTSDKEISIWDITTGTVLRTASVSRWIDRLDFIPGSEYCLSTNIGILDLSQSYDVDTTEAEDASRLFRYRGYSITPDNMWIAKDGQPMIWLQQEYRPGTGRRRPVVLGYKTAIACVTGRVLVINFLEEG
ncbi:Fc.00g027620.m01.CDS01 [Cosmosporella sp. VM-42]